VVIRLELLWGYLFRTATYPVSDTVLCSLEMKLFLRVCLEVESIRLLKLLASAIYKRKVKLFCLCIILQLHFKHLSLNLANRKFPKRKMS